MIKSIRPSKTTASTVEDQSTSSSMCSFLFSVFLFGFPLFWTLMSSFKTTAEMFAYPPVIIPAVPQWSNYVNALTMERDPGSALVHEFDLHRRAGDGRNIF